MPNQINHIEPQYVPKQTDRVKDMADQESVARSSEEIKRRFAKSFLDILILQLVETEPTWGYDIIKKTEMGFGVKLRHGALYPMLNSLETKGLVRGRKQLEKGRVRKIYEITQGGEELLQTYRDFLRQQTSLKGNKSQEETV